MGLKRFLQRLRLCPGRASPHLKKRRRLCPIVVQFHSQPVAIGAATFASSLQALSECNAQLHVEAKRLQERQDRY
eukprot:12895522-Prorocentrum_lima.AAC.1